MGREDEDAGTGLLADDQGLRHPQITTRLVPALDPLVRRSSRTMQWPCLSPALGCAVSDGRQQARESLGDVRDDGWPTVRMSAPIRIRATALPVDGHRGIRLIRPLAAGHPRVALGPADDEQQRKVGASTAGHRASSRAPPVATWTAALIPRRRAGPGDA